MSGTLEAVDAQEVHAKLHRAQSVSDARALVQDHAGWVRLFQLLNDRTRRVAGGLDDSDAFIEDGLRVGGVVRRVHGGEEGKIDTEGVLGHALAFPDLFAQVVGGGLGEGCDDSKTACV